MDLNIIILAAGFGSRLKSKKSKITIPLINKPVIHHIIDNMANITVPDHTYFVIGHSGNDVKKTIEERGTSFNFVWQKEQLGTGHAVLQTKPSIKNKSYPTLILAGDVPLVDEELIKQFVTFHKNSKSDISVLTTEIPSPKGYGRIIRGKDNCLLKIVEEKDASDKEKEIKEINSGIYLVETELLFNLLEKVTPNNNQKEYYLTDIIGLAQDRSLNIHPYLYPEHYKLNGINSRKDLVAIANHIYRRTNDIHLDNGVTILSPETTFIEPDVIIEKDVTIEPFVHIKGKSIIKEDSYIQSYSYLEDYVSKNGEVIRP
jgi:bifunctional UDP-N-acetylglucosamine pyrophosphorylase / glucosamine-1-phosphate N-acetyltransferase